MMGMPLDEVEEIAEKHGVIIDNRVANAAFHCRHERQLARALSGKTIHPLSLTDETYDEDRDFASVRDTQNLPQIGFYHGYRSKLHYIFGDYATALDEADEAIKWLEACRGTVAEFDITCWHMLALLAAAPSDDPDEQADRIRQAGEHLTRFEAWATVCPANFRHILLLGQAELAHREHRLLDALPLYREAAAAARAGGFIQYTALAYERAALCAIENGDDLAARGYLEEAYVAYERWGAHAKTARLAETYPHVLSLRRLSAPDQTGSAQRLDFTSVLKAAQAISGEMEPDGLYRRLMHSLIENAGAQRAVILLREESGWKTVVSGELDDPPDASPADDVPETVVDFVKRTREYLVLDDAKRSTEFGNDPYIRQHHIQSILCAPILLQNELAGLIYLENNLTPGAFTKDRLEVVRILASQAAISIRHAELYHEQVQLAVRLEELVRQRTKALQQSLHELKTTQEQLIQAEKMASLGRMSTGIAHELKNPLNFVWNFARLNEELADELLQKADDHPESALKNARDTLETLRMNAGQITKHSHRADRIVSGMMRHARESGQHREPVAIHALLDQCLGVAMHQAHLDPDLGDIEIVHCFDEHVGHIEAVSQDLGQVFINILMNALHALNLKHRTGIEGYVPTITLSTERRGSEVCIRMADNGVGIPTEIQPKIFEPFFTTKITESSTGLGLSISYEIVTQGHQGELRVESEEGQGATFEILLPG